MGNIDWLPISDLPAELRDGREVLLYDWQGAKVATWQDGAWDSGYSSETGGGPIEIEEPTHFAEINPPV